MGLLMPRIDSQVYWRDRAGLGEGLSLDLVASPPLVPHTGGSSAFSPAFCHAKGVTADPPAAPLPPGPASAYTYGPGAARNPDLEVLLTDGLGGYAMSSLAGVPTRCYSGLVVSQLPPVQRYSHMISPLEELESGGEHVALHALEVAPGQFEGRGLELLTGATVWDLLPEREQLWRGVRVRRQSFMPRESGAVVYLYEVSSRESVTLTLGGFFTDRDMHAVRTSAPNLIFQAGGKRVKVQGEHDTVVRLHLPDLGQKGGPKPGHSVLQESVISAMTPAPFTQRVYYRADAARGEKSSEMVRGCALWRVTFPPGGGRVALSVQGVSPGVKPVRDPWDAYAAEATRRRELAYRAFSATGVVDEVVATLAVAADAYIVKRKQPQGTSVIAGYPWFTDWGRDTMIAVTGLTLVTGQAEIARSILSTYLKSLRRGLAPNQFLDNGQGAGFNTVDAALWLVVALERYVRTTGDGNFARECLPAVREILGWHVQGTDYGIQADPSDGLLRAGEPGLQLTWMDVKIHDWVVTPRHGKPVEIQALWLSALGAEARLSAALGETPRFADVLDRARRGFAALWQHVTPELVSSDRASLADLLGLNTTGPGGLTGLVAMGDPTMPAPSQNAVSLGALDEIDREATANNAASVRSARAVLADVLTPVGVDLSVRPNAVIALALADTPATEAQVDAVIAQAEEQLLTPLGLHSLSPLDHNYQGGYGGPQLVRDATYHQGTVWPWPLGSYIELLLSRGEVARARTTLAGLIGHVWEAGVGHVSEVFSGDSLAPGGCPFQAWSVAELLRAHILVSLAEGQRAQQASGAAQNSPQPSL